MGSSASFLARPRLRPRRNKEAQSFFLLFFSFRVFRIWSRMSQLCRSLCSRFVSPSVSGFGRASGLSLHLQAVESGVRTLVLYARVALSPMPKISFAYTQTPLRTLLFDNGSWRPPLLYFTLYPSISTLRDPSRVALPA